MCGCWYVLVGHMNNDMYVYMYIFMCINMIYGMDMACANLYIPVLIHVVHMRVELCVYTPDPPAAVFPETR